MARRVRAMIRSVLWVFEYKVKEIFIIKNYVKKSTNGRKIGQVESRIGFMSTLCTFDVNFLALVIQSTFLSYLDTTNNHSLNLNDFTRKT